LDVEAHVAGVETTESYRVDWRCTYRRSATLEAVIPSLDSTRSLTRLGCAIGLRGVQRKRSRPTTRHHTTSAIPSTVPLVDASL
jgi:hypothetical protein